VYYDRRCLPTLLPSDNPIRFFLFSKRPPPCSLSLSVACQRYSTELTTPWILWVVSEIWWVQITDHQCCHSEGILASSPPQLVRGSMKLWPSRRIAVLRERLKCHLDERGLVEGLVACCTLQFHQQCLREGEEKATVRSLFNAARGLEGAFNHS
jgi:hypothetical protein